MNWEWVNREFLRYLPGEALRVTDGPYKPVYAVAMELRKADAVLDAKFSKLPERTKWAWLAYCCDVAKNGQQGYAYAQRLVASASSLTDITSAALSKGSW